MKYVVFVIACMVATAFAGATAEPSRTADGYMEATAPWDWHFPSDHGRHDGFKTEWWYFTGNVSDSSGRPFGFELTFFRTALTPQTIQRKSGWALRDLYFAHGAISDLRDKIFLFKDRIERGRPGFAWADDAKLDVTLLDWVAQSDDRNDIHLVSKSDDFAIDLTCAPGRGPILEGPAGVNRKGPTIEQASYYYSMTRLPTTGTLSVKGQTFGVSGQTWMDHEFSSNALSADQVGWDWMGLNLADGNDLMVYRMRNKTGGNNYLSATLIPPQGPPQYLNATQLALTGDDPWTSQESGGTYPQRWRLRAGPLGDLTIQSAMPGQELLTGDTTHVDYFEGSCRVTDANGKPDGQGYLEMTGYANSVPGT